MTYDAIVIGAGINGLVAANYLARARQRVLVVESSDIAGGTHVTEEIAPGFAVDRLAHDVGWFPPRIAADLQLASHGLVMEQSDISVFAPQPDGRPLTLYRDPARTVSAIAEHSRRDAERWPDFARRMSRLTGFLAHVYSGSPPQLLSSNIADLFMLLGVGRKLRGLGKTDMLELLRTLPMAVSELLDDTFESDALKGVLGAGGVTNIMQGPRSGGTSFVMLHHEVGAPEGEFRARRIPSGGVGALSAALLAAAKAGGVEVRLGTRARHVAVEKDRATGILIEGGSHVAAPRVISSLDARRTLLGLVDPGLIEPELARALLNIRFRGIRAKVNLALSQAPSFAAVTGDGEHLSGAISLAPNLDYLERAYDGAKHGRVSQAPYLEARISPVPGHTTSARAPHVMSIAVQFVPYTIEGGWTSAARDALGDTVLATLEPYAPGISKAVVHREVLTPADIERRTGAAEGNMYQGEMTLDQILFMRPVAGWSRYRTPVHGVYLCGAGTHPGGGIPGAAGHNAAKAVLKDR